MEELWDSACIKAIRTPQEVNVGIWDRALFTGAKHASPIFRNYVDILAGHQGKFKSMLGWGAGTEATYLATKDIFPSRTYEISPVDQKAPVDMPVDIRMDTKKSEKIEDKIINDPDNTQVKDYTEETKNFEENKSGGSDVDNDEASAAANSDPDLAIDNDSIARINQYKDVMRQVLGQSSGGDKMQQSAMLMQLGAALMAGKTREPGVNGFFEVVGNAAAQTAPMLFQMGAEKAKADRELTASAMELYFDEIENNKRTGPYVWVYKNNYKTNPDGTFQRDENNNFIPAGPPTRVRQVRRNSPEETYYYDLNNKYGYDLFNFVEAGEGQDALSMTMGGGSATMPTDQSMADQRKYGFYVQRGLKELAEVIMPTIIDSQHLIGVKGEIGRRLGPLAELVQQAAEDGEFRPRYEAMVKDIINNEFGDFTVFDSNATINWGGEVVPVFIDKKNKYGQNEIQFDVDGDIVSEAGAPKVYFTKDSLEKILLDPRRSALETFETTLGLMLARDRQPTGRMLADVLRRSFEDTALTGILSRSNSPKQVINNYMKIYTQLHGNMIRALEASGLTNDKELAVRKGLEYAPDNFNFAELGDFENAYYHLRTKDPANYSEWPDIPGGTSYIKWKHGHEGNLQQDYEEDMYQSNSIFNKYADKWGIDIEAFE